MDDIDSHAPKVKGLFGRIAGVYDILNTVFSLGFDALWRKRLAQSAGEFLDTTDAPLLDLAAGTLKVTGELAKRYPGKTILSMDFCPPMLVKGLPVIARYPQSTILPVAADALRLPLPDASVSAITVAFGLRNFKPRDKALQEARRVLVPGGKLCVLEFGSARDRIMFGLYNWYLATILPFFGRLVSRDQGAYQYLADTIAAFPSAKELEAEMRVCEFVNVRHTRYTAGIVCLHTGTVPVKKS